VTQRKILMGERTVEGKGGGEGVNGPELWPTFGEVEIAEKQVRRRESFLFALPQNQPFSVGCSCFDRPPKRWQALNSQLRPLRRAYSFNDFP